MLNSCVMHRHTGPSPGIMVWGDIGYHPRTSLVCIASTLNSQCYISEILEPIVLPYLQGLATAIFQQGLTQITPPAATPDKLCQRVKTAWSSVPQEHTQSLFESMPRRVQAVISNNDGYSGYGFWQEPHFTEVYKFNHF
ncbi:transposable element Tcb1 transposase [Trichonephila clavipes]|nr:transposable element Tcb1 transposase [Trichonephila clavipes]